MAVYLSKMAATMVGPMSDAGATSASPEFLFGIATS